MQSRSAAWSGSELVISVPIHQIQGSLLVGLSIVLMPDFETMIAWALMSVAFTTTISLSVAAPFSSSICRLKEEPFIALLLIDLTNAVV